MAHSTRELPRESWRTYFDDLSRELGTIRTTVEVDGRDIGAQIEAEGLLLTGISYDDRDDVLVVGLGGPQRDLEEVEHFVGSPQRILVDGEEGALPETIDVEDADGHRTLVMMHPVPALPSE
jgi:Family of unknown function (DUF5335)